MPFKQILLLYTKTGLYNSGTIENHLDMDLLIWLMAYNNVLVNLDSYLERPRHNFYVIWADNDAEQTGVHVSFKLNSSGESLYLIDPTISIVDEITFAVQTEDIIFGRYPNGIGPFNFMSPTYAANNLPLLSNVSEFEGDKNDVVIYPNPASDEVIIQISDILQSEKVIINRE